MVPLAKKEVEMRLLAVLIALGALCQTALAQAPDCQSIANPGARLACYDKAAPPAASAKKSTTAKSAVPAPAKALAAKADTEKYVDSIAAEDALMNARLKNICRGC
jgi:hypothetical protein